MLPLTCLARATLTEQGLHTRQPTGMPPLQLHWLHLKPETSPTLQLRWLHPTPLNPTHLAATLAAPYYLQPYTLQLH